MSAHHTKLTTLIIGYTRQRISLVDSTANQWTSFGITRDSETLSHSPLEQPMETRRRNGTCKQERPSQSHALLVGTSAMSTLCHRSSHWSHCLVTVRIIGWWPANESHRYVRRPYWSVTKYTNISSVVGGPCSGLLAFRFLCGAGIFLSIGIFGRLLTGFQQFTDVYVFFCNDKMDQSCTVVH